MFQKHIVSEVWCRWWWFSLGHQKSSINIYLIFLLGTVHAIGEYVRGVGPALHGMGTKLLSFLPSSIIDLKKEKSEHLSTFGFNEQMRWHHLERARGIRARTDHDPIQFTWAASDFLCTIFDCFVLHIQHQKQFKSLSLPWWGLHQ